MLRVFTAFSGYDSQCMALDQIGINYDLVGWSEIDKFAIEAHNRFFPQYKDRNLGDISRIEWDNVPDFDLFTYSSPCQDFSRAGFNKRKDAQKKPKSEEPIRLEDTIKMVDAIDNIPDQALVNELRQRGYDVTCTKIIEL